MRLVAAVAVYLAAAVLFAYGYVTDGPSPTLAGIGLFLVGVIVECWATPPRPPSVP